MRVHTHTEGERESNRQEYDFWIEGASKHIELLKISISVI